MEGYNTIKLLEEKPIGYLLYEPTKTHIPVYKPISRFKAPMINGASELNTRSYETRIKRN